MKCCRFTESGASIARLQKNDKPHKRMFYNKSRLFTVRWRTCLYYWLSVNPETPYSEIIILQAHNRRLNYEKYCNTRNLTNRHITMIKKWQKYVTSS